jgi:ABC-2 type transport system ATP-binding protein
VRAIGNVLSFVETRFSEEELNTRIAAVAPAVRSVDVQPMPLRSIFTVLARNAQRTAS